MGVRHVAQRVDYKRRGRTPRSPERGQAGETVPYGSSSTGNRRLRPSTASEPDGTRSVPPSRLGRANTIGRIVVSFLDGAHRNAVRTHRVLSPATAWQCQHAQSAGAQRDPVRRRAGVQVARVAEALWELAHDLHPHESLVQERGARPGLRTPATRPVDPHQVGGGVAGQHHRQGPSRRHGGSKKTAPKPSANPAAGGPPRFIWLPRMLERH